MCPGEEEGGGHGSVRRAKWPEERLSFPKPGAPQANSPPLPETGRVFSALGFDPENIWVLSEVAGFPL